jgi:hypothetical protein
VNHLILQKRTSSSSFAVTEVSKYNTKFIQIKMQVGKLPSEVHRLIIIQMEIMSLVYCGLMIFVSATAFNLQ